MKRNIWFIMLAVITISCVIGGTFYHLGSLRTGRVYPGRGTTEHSEQGMDAFTRIELEADVVELSITKGDGYHLRYEYGEGCEPVYTVMDGTLTITQKLPAMRYGARRASDKCSLSLTVPEGAGLDAMDIRTAMGDIYIGEVGVLQCEIEGDLGDLTIEHCSFGSFDAALDLGDIEVSGSELGDASIDGEMGNIIVSDCTFDDLAIEASAGNIRVDTGQDLNGYQVDLGSSLGSVTVNGDRKKTSFYQSGSAGSLRLWADAGNVRLDHGK